MACERQRHKYPDWECPRCGYTTNIKANIKAHFARKKPCPAPNPKAIVLTDDIKRFVLDNRAYRPEPEASTSDKNTSNNASTSKTGITNYIQVNNQVNNILNTMDYQSKAQKYIKYMNKNKKETDPPLQIQSYKDHVEEVLFDAGLDTENLKRLMNAPYIPDLTEHTNEDHIDTIDKVTRKSVPTKLIGVMYDAKSKRMYLYDEDEWEDLQEKPGIKKLVSHIRQLYWNTYEEYLIKKMRSHNNMQQRQRAKELLEDYYVFLNTFALKPEHLDEATYKIWSEKTKENKSTTNAIYKDVMNIIKNNSTSNIKLLNKDITKLLKLDKEFEESFFKEEESEVEVIDD